MSTAFVHKSAIFISEVLKYDIIIRVNHEPVLMGMAKNIHLMMDLRKTGPVGGFLKGLHCRCHKFHGLCLMSKTAPYPRAIVGQSVLWVGMKEAG